MEEIYIYQCYKYPNKNLIAQVVKDERIFCWKHGENDKGLLDRLSFIQKGATDGNAEMKQLLFLRNTKNEIEEIRKNLDFAASDTINLLKLS